MNGRHDGANVVHEIIVAAAYASADGVLEGLGSVAKLKVSHGFPQLPQPRVRVGRGHAQRLLGAGECVLSALLVEQQSSLLAECFSQRGIQAQGVVLFGHRFGASTHQRQRDAEDAMGFAVVAIRGNGLQSALVCLTYGSRGVGLHPQQQIVQCRVREFGVDRSASRAKCQGALEKAAGDLRLVNIAAPEVGATADEQPLGAEQLFR